MHLLRSSAKGTGYHHVGNHDVSEEWTESEGDPNESREDEGCGDKVEKQRAFLKKCSVCTVCASLGVLAFQGYAYNVVFLGRILPAVGKELLVIPSGILFNVLWMLSLWSYAQANRADPGKVPQEWYDFVDRAGDGLLVDAPRMEWQPGRASLCSKCMAPRPERAHHCFVCDFCVLRMDHHCPWINNCVGFKNHKFFLLLGVYACLAGYAMLVTSLPELVQVATMLAGWGGSEPQDVLDASDAYILLAACCLAGAVAVALTALLYVHAPLALQNATTIEDNYENMPNPFDKGNSLENLAQVLGEFGVDWALPIAPRRPLSDGISFSRTKGDAVVQGLSDVPQDEEEANRLWTLRYEVRTRQPSANSKAIGQADGPVTMFARFLLGSSATSGANPKGHQGQAAWTVP
jgi:hypothetical protein